MSKCENCGATLLNRNAKCTYCNTTYLTTVENVTPAAPIRSDEAMRTERDSKQYLTAARYCGYTVVATLVLVILQVIVFGSKGKDSFLMEIVKVVSSISMYAGIIFFIIGKIKKKKAEKMK